MNASVEENIYDGPREMSLWSVGVVPDVFTQIKFLRTDKVASSARSHVPVQGVAVVLYSGVIRPQLKVDEERENYYFLHREAAERELLDQLDGSKLEYGLADIREDFQTKGIAVLISHGGYFSGAIFKGPECKSVLHKSFRRYVQRKGQGHKQSKHANKNASHKCRSAGGRLRTFNEQKQRDETVELLQLWSEELKQVSCVWLVAPGENRKIFLEELPKELNIRFVPMTCGRATFAACRKIAEELGRVTLEEHSVKEEEDDDSEDEKLPNYDYDYNDDYEDEEEEEQDTSSSSLEEEENANLYSRIASNHQ